MRWKAKKSLKEGAMEVWGFECEEREKMERDGALVGQERAIALERLMSRSSAIPPEASQNEFYPLFFFISSFLTLFFF